MIPATNHDVFERKLVQVVLQKRLSVRSVARIADQCGFPGDPDDAKALGCHYWDDARPGDRLSHLFLALWQIGGNDIKRRGLEHHYAILDRLVEGTPDLADLHGFARLLADAKASLVEDIDGGLLQFLGNLPLLASGGRLSYGGFSMGIDRALELAAGEPAGIWRLRRRLVSGHAEFDRVASGLWEAIHQRATSTFYVQVPREDGYQSALAIYLERYHVDAGEARALNMPGVAEQRSAVRRTH